MQHFCGGYFKGNAGDFRHVRKIKKLVRQKSSQQTFFFFLTKERAKLHFMGLTIRPKIKADRRESE